MNMGELSDSIRCLRMLVIVYLNKLMFCHNICLSTSLSTLTASDRKRKEDGEKEKCFLFKISSKATTLK